MKFLFPIAGLLVTASPQAALAQMHMPGMTMPMPSKAKPPAKKKAAPAPTTKKGTAAKPKPKPKAKPADPSPHHAMPGMEMPSNQAMPGHDTDSHGMGEQDMPPMGNDDLSTMSGHDMSAMEAPSGTDLPAGNAPPPPVPADHAADRIYGSDAMSTGRHHLTFFHGGQHFTGVSIDLFEMALRKGQNGYRWNGEAWTGGDLNRLMVRSEGEGAFGERVEHAEVQALYSRAIGPYFDLQAGIRQDFRPNASRTWASVGVEGLAPYWFDVGASLFLSTKGELAGRLEGSTDQRITQRLILQPRVELNLSLQDIPETGTGAGFSTAGAGLRLRYEVAREFAPYVGVSWEHAFGATRRFRVAEGEDSGGASLVFGIKTWF